MAKGKNIFADLLPYIGAAVGTMVAPGVGTSAGYSLGKVGGSVIRDKNSNPSIEMSDASGEGILGQSNYLSGDELSSQNKANGIGGGGFDIGSIMSMLGKGGGSGGGSPFDFIGQAAGGMQSEASPKKDYFGGMSAPMVGNVNPFSAPQSILEKLKMQKMYR